MNLEISSLLTAYRNHTRTPREVISTLQIAIEKAPSTIWISKSTPQQLESYLKNLEGKSPDDLHLYGIPFAIKDSAVQIRLIIHTKYKTFPVKTQARRPKKWLKT